MSIQSATTKITCNEYFEKFFFSLELLVIV